MNLRDTRLSSRALIPLALALPINQGPVDLRIQEEREREARTKQRERDAHDVSVSFYL